MRGCLGGQAEAANASGNAFSVEYERGACLGGTPGCSCGQTGKGGWSKQVADTPQTQPVGPYSMPCDVTDESRVEKAAAVAAEADVTLLVIGDSSTLSTAKNATPYFREVRRHGIAAIWVEFFSRWQPCRCGQVATVGEHFDRDNLDPAGAQLPLLRAVVKASKNTIVVLIHGRTVTFGAGPGDGYNELFEQAAAVVAAWHPGEEGGHALWNILNGTVNPSGRTAHTWRASDRSQPLSALRKLSFEKICSRMVLRSEDCRAGAHVRAALSGAEHAAALPAVCGLCPGLPARPLRLRAEL